MLNTRVKHKQAKDSPRIILLFDQARLFRVNINLLLVFENKSFGLLIFCYILSANTPELVKLFSKFSIFYRKHSQKDIERELCA